MVPQVVVDDPVPSGRKASGTGGGPEGYGVPSLCMKPTRDKP
jgi:hypothetical protein